jgi:hypothetical protein
MEKLFVEGVVMTIPSTTERVHLNTAPKWNQKIEERTRRSIAYYSAHPEEIASRLEQLDHEWDIERTLEANAATVSVVSVLLGMLVNRKWLFLPAIVGGFLLNHAVKGWCPPLPVFRRRGIRTQTEIDRERYALKALRGDFNRFPEGRNVTDRDAQRILQTVK